MTDRGSEETKDLTPLASPEGQSGRMTPCGTPSSDDSVFVDSSHPVSAGDLRAGGSTAPIFYPAGGVTQKHHFRVRNTSATPSYARAQFFFSREVMASREIHMTPLSQTTKTLLQRRRNRHGQFTPLR